jgi:hypothetical protein
MDHTERRFASVPTPLGRRDIMPPRPAALLVRDSLADLAARAFAPILLAGAAAVTAAWTAFLIWALLRVIAR